MISISDNEFNELTTFLKTKYGINLNHKKNLIEGRLTNVLIEKGFHNFREYLDYVFGDITKNELTVLINKITTNHTYFMREAEHFSYFKETILPSLEYSVKDKDLRIWSAGCSSGEEPYSLAMIMEDYFGEEKSRWDKKILATDISVQVLEKAESGVYGLEDLKNVPNHWLTQYFTNINTDNFQIISSLKEEVIFRTFNLMDPFPFRRKFHVIFCRNVMIYFDKVTKEKLIQKFYDMTEPGGYLFIGLSETLNRDVVPYKYIMPSVYKKG